ncbi:hypothetical protein JVT61DRAFT_9437 [Boletus reticuloceps]|uniref:Uncharacterized protein n=1 Tax=Boletus reticuloceps TaxID=495285 RepID=A0A8I2YG97_9AGAM|nr:hypothetical protein JVT61DRAFT_9437 [Boletus reticuloceps]
MDATYDFSFYNNSNGYSANTNVGPTVSENMHDTLGVQTDVFGRIATPQTNLNPINQPSLAYSQANLNLISQPSVTQEAFIFKECCKVLDAQLLKVTTERDTLKMMFEKLSTSLQNSTTVPSSSSVTMTKNAKSYPKRIQHMDK